ncbi:MAG: SEL1-like repeat protein [Rhodanobacteraceae bacterium]|nr:SEL1-like repeat protein [Rhodanobacteraceae bacterium]
MAVSNTLHAYALSVAIAATMVLVALPVNAPRASIRNAEDMMIVDCLLPGTVRKLGKMSTYMSARRPIRTIQSDCEIRGGEYVAYDRANYETALKVWMAQAESGDAEAQNYVGEIYDKGLGIAPDPTRAAPWYEKAAAQGLKRAKINLGYLYEQGLGVPKDMTHALNLYRDASGLIGDDLVYASTMTAAVSAKEGEIAGLRQDIEQQKAAADRLRTENEKLKSELGSRKHAVETAQVELQKARDELAAKQSQLGAATPDMIALNDKLAREQERIELERAKLEQDQRRHAAQRDADQKRLTDLRARNYARCTGAARWCRCRQGNRRTEARARRSIRPGFGTRRRNRTHDHAGDGAQAEGRADQGGTGEVRRRAQADAIRGRGIERRPRATVITRTATDFEAA